MNPSFHRAAVRGAVVVGTSVVVAIVGAAPALAHVTAQPGQAPQGGYTVVTFRVPDESDTAGTVKLQVTLPTDHPITSVRTTPIPGWAAAVAKTTLNPPAQVNGNGVTEAIGSVTWTANPGVRINPGEYLDFPLSLGPLPTGVDQIAMPAVQTYDNGEVVSWDQPSTGGAEPERPAPVVTLTAAAAGDAMADHDASSPPEAPPATTAAPSGSDPTARWLAGAGLLVGALGLGVGASAVARTRRSGTR
jgi:uncharacterized protein YcnI